MAKYFFVLVLISSLYTNSVYGQSDSLESKEVTVYLKNGKYIHGYQSLSPFRGYLTVELDRFSQKHIPYKKIEHINYGPPLPEPPPFIWEPKSSFILSLMFGVQFGNMQEGDNRAAISLLVGYRFNPKLQTSIGIGFMQYDPLSTTTFFGRVHGLLNDKRWSPMYFVEAGASRVHAAWYGFNLEIVDAKGGLTFHPGVGIQRNFRGGAIFFQAGYRIQRAKMDYVVQDFWGGSLQVQEQLTFRRVTTTIGLTF